MEELYIQMLGEFSISSSRGKLTWEALRVGIRCFGF